MSHVAPRQPWLHEMAICVRGNVTAVSRTDGDISRHTAAGLYVDDHRAVSELRLTLGGEAPVMVSHGARGSVAHFLAAARNLAAPTPDPTVEVRRRRELVAGGMEETVAVTSRAAGLLETDLRIVIASDGAPIDDIKSGRVTHPTVAPEIVDKGAVFHAPWHDCELRFTPPPSSLVVQDGSLVATFPLELDPQRTQVVRLRIRGRRNQPSVLDADPGQEVVAWDEVTVTSADPRLQAAVTTSLEDLHALLLVDPLDDRDAFVAAGTPWYLTLFGRDSIWSARMALPLGTQLAGGTLRALARRQGRKYDPVSAEAPGKIPHEVRRFPYVDEETGMSLPAVYYGTVDATSLWVTLLHEAWRWGLPHEEVVDLGDALAAAVGWLLGDASPDSDGLLKYHDVAGTGLSNQGWKDSGDAMRFRDGTVAAAPIALVEAQAYAAQALDSAAELLEVMGREVSPLLKERSHHLQRIVRERFWVSSETGDYLGLAVDGQGNLVDGRGSNMAHVLGTGILTTLEAATVAKSLCGEDLLDEFGVRTLGRDNGGFNPLGYHTGSIWAHDTAIAALGLSREGRAADSVRVARTLLASAEVFDYRWPELFTGEPTMGRPAAYPAACRPQAWAAASAVVLLSVALGPRPDAAARTLHLHPVRPAAFGALRVEGLRFCGGRVDLEVADDGGVTVVRAPEDVNVVVH